MSPITLQENEGATPLCPHCEKELREMQYQSLRTTLGRRYVYFCEACRKVLGVSHRKGFWMG